MPKSMDEVIEFAKEQNKFRIASVELNPCLAGITAGDNIITKKGNSIYVLKAIEESLDNLSPETQEYLDTLAREYGLKKVGITSVDTIVKFETWCKSAKPIINPKNVKKEMTKNSIKGFADRLKSMFMPVEAKDVRIATDGNICVATAQGYVSIDANNKLTSYPTELTLDLPVFIVSKPKEQLTVGDVIATERGYAKVVKIDGDKITAIELAPAKAVEKMIECGMTPQMIVQYKTVDQLKGIAEASAQMFEHVHLGEVTVYGNENTAGNFMAKTAENLNPALDLLRSIPLKETFKDMFGKKAIETKPESEEKPETFEEVK